jgi:hypothetical protein
VLSGIMEGERGMMRNSNQLNLPTTPKTIQLDLAACILFTFRSYS